MQYEDLSENIRPKTDDDYPKLAFQILLDEATGVNIPPKELNTEGGDFEIIKREVRVILYDSKTNQYLSNTACVRSEWKKADQDKWKFNAWSKVGTNPLVFSSKDEELIKEDSIKIVFEFVMLCKMGSNFKDISCGFCMLDLKKIRDKETRKATEFCEIQGGSPDLPIPLDPCDFTEGMGFFHKMKRGKIQKRLKVKLRFFESFSDEGKFNLAMLPKTCLISKKLMHFATGYRNYLAKKLCKENKENAGLTMPT